MTNSDCESCDTATLNHGSEFNEQQKKYKKKANTGCLENINYYKLINEPLREGFTVASSSSIPSSMASSSAVSSVKSAVASASPDTSGISSAKVSASAKASSSSFPYSTMPASSTTNSPSLLGSNVARSYLGELQVLDTQFNSLVEQYNTTKNSLITTTQSYISKASAKNPYLGTNITTNNGKSYYITEKGVAKMYDSTSSLDETMNNHGCPGSSKALNITELPSDISSGTAMVSGQSCGNEGKNVYVSSVVSKPTTTYVGCYTDSASNPAMTAVNNGAQIYNYNTCMQAAIDKGSSYFALQNADSTNGTATCMISSDIGTAQQYGVASSNCPTGSDNYVYGGTNINAVYKTPDAVYVDTFIDNPNRAMTSVSNGSRTFTYDTCKQAAIDANQQFFGLQNLNENTQKAQCFIGNDYSTVSKYGSARKGKTIKGKDRKKYGGGWANAVYQITTTDGNYIGCYKDDPTKPAMEVVNGGANTYSFSSCQQEAITLGKSYFGLQGGTAGSSQCFVSNNLTEVKQYGLSLPCSKQADQTIAGNANVNAIYQLNQVGNPIDMGKIGYVDENTLLSEYPSSMLTPGTTYNKISNYDSPGNDLDGNPLQNSSVSDCTTSCNNSSSCVGFAFDNATNNCWLKNSNAYPKGERVPNPTTDYYVRQLNINNANSCSKTVSNVDSLQWEKYPKKSSKMTPKTPCGYGSNVEDTQVKLSTLEKQIQNITSKIVGVIEKIEDQNINVNQNISTTDTTLDDYIKKYKNIASQIVQNDIPTQKIIVEDSDVYVLQENYSYMFWSILAIISVIVAMNLSRKTT